MTVGSTDLIGMLEEKKRLLKSFKDRAEKVKDSRIRNEARLEHLLKTENDIIDRIKNLGYDPDNLKSHIDSKLTELKAITNKLAEVMPDSNGIIPANAKEILNIGNSEIVENDDNIIDDVNLDDLPI